MSVSTDRGPLAGPYKEEVREVAKAYKNWVRSTDSDTVLLREALLSNWLGPPPQEPANPTAADSATAGANI